MRPLLALMHANSAGRGPRLPGFCVRQCGILSKVSLCG